ncbi:MAG: PIN domain-containing protein [Spirochaetaceae bacterium]|nr:MAG: PIN domain-containing protein [Spirochaetaceae bacterium]
MLTLEVSIRAGEQVDTIVQDLAIVRKTTNIKHTWRPDLRDERDNMGIELARASGSEYLITSDTRDFRLESDLNNDDIRIVSPGGLMNE